MVGRQQLSSVRPWVTVMRLPNTDRAAGDCVHCTAEFPACACGGVVVGVCLGVYGLRMTRFEKTPQGLFYTPNAHLGIALSLLLVGRIIYRFIQVYSATGSAAAAQQVNYTTTPLTLLIFGTLAGYYFTYAVGLLRWQRESAKADVSL